MLDKIKQGAAKVFKTLTDTRGRHLTPAAVLTINGQPFGTQTMSRIISIEMTDKRGFEADELTITLDDHDGSLAIPKIGDKITLEMGYKETGLVDKGEYLFTEFTASGAPDMLSITARAADLAETLAQQRKKAGTDRRCIRLSRRLRKNTATRTAFPMPTSWPIFRI